MNRSLMLGCMLAAHVALAHAAPQVTLQNAWMRPAPEGAGIARVYVDIKSDANVTLEGASTPIAKKVEIVRVKTIGDPSTETVVAKLAVPFGTTTRLAYLGDHLRLVNVKHTVTNGSPVPLKLRFVDAKGKRFDVAADVLVRGILLVPQEADAAPAKQN
jgi:copper(I)-binding protein